MSNTTIDQDALRFTHEREQDGKVAITLHLGAGQTFTRSIHTQENEARAAMLNELCAEFPGLDRAWARAEILKIARATKIDLRWDITRKINGTAASSARLWISGKPIETVSLNLFDPKKRNASVEYLAPFVAGKGASKKKLEAASRELHKLFKEKLQEVMAAPAQPPRPGFDPNQPERIAYDMIDGVGIIWRKPTAGGGEWPTPLTNFTAKILANVVRTDGVEKTSDLEIEAALKGRAPQRFTLKSTEFADMKWPARILGGEAIIEPEDGFSRRAAVAIQKLSTDVVQKVHYTHTGWLESDGVWVYLHAGGIIGPEGTELPKIDVALSEALARYSLPAPPADPAYLKQCLRASLRFLQLGAPHITYPLYCAIWRPLFGECGLSSFINGRTQSFKSEVMSLMCRHYASKMHATAFPGGWDSTLNYLRDMSFKVKDAPFPVDDFKPGVLRAKDAADLHKLAEKFLRAQANLSERGRCDEYGNSRGAKPPRGMVYATGEELPYGQSLRARLWITDLSPRDIDSSILSLCQRDAHDGLFATLMSGAIRWLATNGRIGAIRGGFRSELEAQRQTAIAALKRMNLSGDDLRRTCDNTLNLALAFRYFLDFALDARAISDGEASTLHDDCWAALADSAELQAKHQREEDPVSRFFRLLKSALSSGLAFISAADGSEPGAEHNLACGYRRRGSVWDPGRTRIGCWTPQCLCLDTETSFRVANDVVGPSGDGIGVTSPAALGKHLAAKGMLVGADEDDRHGRRTDRRRIAGELRMVWRVRHEALDIAGETEGGMLRARAPVQAIQEQDLAEQSFDFGPSAEESR